MAIVLALLTVVISSYIRLAESGLGCEPWPACYGKYHTDVNANGINVLKQQSEEVAFKSERIFHRLVASMLGLLVVVLFFLSLRPDYYQKTGRLIPALLLLLTLMLAIIGPLRPESPLPIITFGNFSGGLTIVALLFYLYLKVSANGLKIDNSDYPGLLRLGIIIIIIQILWGGWTSANYAGTSCEKLLSCNIPVEGNVAVSEAINPVSGLLLDQYANVIIEPKMHIIQFIHHLLAVVSLCVFAVATFLLYRRTNLNKKSFYKECLIVVSLLALQFIIGLSTVAFDLPLLIVVLHNLLAAILVLSITSIYMKLSTRNNL